MTIAGGPFLVSSGVLSCVVARSSFQNGENCVALPLARALHLTISVQSSTAALTLVTTYYRTDSRWFALPSAGIIFLRLPSQTSLWPSALVHRDSRGDKVASLMRAGQGPSLQEVHRSYRSIRIRILRAESLSLNCTKIASMSCLRCSIRNESQAYKKAFSLSAARLSLCFA